MLNFLLSIYLLIFYLNILNSNYYIYNLWSYWDSKFITAVYNDDREVINECLKHELNFNARDVYGRTALIYAVNKKNMYMIDLLLRNKADINLYDNYELATPVIHAVHLKDENIINLLLDQGAYPLIKDVYKRDLLFYASFYDLKNLVIRLLKDYKFNINDLDYLGNNILKYLIENLVDYDIIEILVKHGINVNFIDNNGNSMLMLAAFNLNKYKNWSMKVISLLLKNGFNRFLVVNKDNLSLKDTLLDKDTIEKILND
jgi:ankyrin repeat protein